MLSEMCFSILLMRWVFLSLQSPVGSGQGGGRSPRRPRGAPGHTWTCCPRAGTAADTQPGPAAPKFTERPWRVERGWLEVAQRQFPLRSLSLLLPLGHSPSLYIVLSLLTGATDKRAPLGVCAGTWVVKASSTNTLSTCAPLPTRLKLPARPCPLQEATIKPMSIMSPVHFRKGRSRPQLPQWKIVSGSHCEHRLIQPLHRCVSPHFFVLFCPFQPGFFPSFTSPLSRRGSSPVFTGGAEGVQGDGDTRAHT